MTNGYLRVACSYCGNSDDPLGVMYDAAGALSCFWCQGEAVARAK
jgi:hypothetical protein